MEAGVQPLNQPRSKLIVCAAAQARYDVLERADTKKNYHSTHVAKAMGKLPMSLPQRNGGLSTPDFKIANPQISREGAMAVFVLPGNEEAMKI